MTMNRAIHAAVRRDLDRLEGALRALPDGDRDRVQQLGRAWKNFLHQLTDHHEKEDELIWPALLGLGVDPMLLMDMEQEHQRMAAALAETDAVMGRLAVSASRADALAAAASVVTTREVVERHLKHEEDELEPEQLKHVDSPEWKAVEKKLRGDSPVAGGRTLAWVLDGAGPEADRYVRSLIPGPVLFVLTRVLGSGYQRTVAPVWRA
jgi:hemerythrin-like domain-containing protein